MRNATKHEVMATLKSLPKDVIEVTWCSTGVTRCMWEHDFIETFGGEVEAQEVLAGYHPDIVAVRKTIAGRK